MQLKLLLLLSTIFIGVQLIAAEKIYDTVIIGGGIGGLTSALYLSRAGVSPLVIEGDKPGGALAQSPKVQNWPAELDIAGAALVAKIKNQVEANGAQFLNEKVIGIDLSKRPFTLTTRPIFGLSTPRVIKTQTAIIAMGSNPRLLNVPGEKTYFSKGVYSCAVCDGSLYKNKIVAVIGGGDAAITEAHYLAGIAKKVFVIVRGQAFKTLENARRDALLTKSNVEVMYQTTVQEIKGDKNQVTSIALLSQKPSTVAVDAVFLAIGSIPNSTLLKNQIELDKQGFVILKNFQETSLPGVYAVGDIADPVFQQAISAAGDGAKAAIQAKAYLSSLPATEQLVNINASSKQPTAEIIEIQDTAQHNKAIKSSELPILIDFDATWCGPCNQFTPIYKKLADTFAGKIKFLKVNIDTNQELAHLYKIQGIPTLVVLDTKGNLIAKKTGTYEINTLTT
ncbi:MAG: FAD-dependent oxidoreductase, partial [Chlamydiota bacterium]